MSDWQTVELGDVARTLSRYRPYLLAVAAVTMVAVFLPGDPPMPEATTTFAGTDGFGTADSADGATGGTSGFAAGDGPATGSAAGGDTTVTTGQRAGSTGDTTGGDAGAGGSGGAAGTSAGGTNGGATGGAAAPAPASAGGGDPLANPYCDPERGRVRIPSVFAAPCMSEFPEGADNGGATYRGVTADKIIVAIRQGESDPAVSAIITAAGAEDTEEQVRATRQGWIDLFAHFYETYGREVEIVYFDESGEDDQAERADAIKVANEIGAFASWGDGGTYRDELIARGVMCLCTPADQEQADQFPGLTWGSPLENLFVRWAEYVGKRVRDDRPAEFAGDVTYTTQDRQLGVVHLDTEDGAVTGEMDFFQATLRDEYGVQLTDRISYLPDINTAQEQARTIIARLKDKGITTVLFYGDPIAPIFLTNEATNQRYFPEWVIAGSFLVDTTFFGRTYDQVQWENAFGHSELWSRAPQEVDEVFHLWNWYYGGEDGPPAQATYEIIYQNVWEFMTGLHLTGPTLDPGTYTQGLFSYPPSGGGPTTPSRSYGNHGFFPWTDWGMFDDSTEVWWDPNAVGENEIGQQGRGMWRYVDGGTRYKLGEWPNQPTKAFQLEGSVTKHDDLPPEDQYPEYDCPDCPSSQDGG